MERVARELSFCENLSKKDVLWHYVTVMGAVVELAVALGREVGQGKAWPGTVTCSLPAAPGLEASQGKMEGVGRRKGVMPWNDSKAAHPALSRGGDAVLCPWNVPNLVFPGGLCHQVASDLWPCL